ITPGVTYVASYYAPSGGYSSTTAYFASAGADNGPLHSLANGVDGSNGLYRYGSGGGFPTNSYNATNYWVDILFNAIPDTTAPAVASTAPGPNATAVSATAVTSATFSKPVQVSTISFVLRDSANNLVPSTVTYDANTRTAMLAPTSSLTGLTTYTATVSGATDLSGNAMNGPATWSFTTAA